LDAPELASPALTFKDLRADRHFMQVGFNTPCAMSARRIQCAAHRLP